MVDDFSRYLEVENISSLTAKVVIHILEGLFARWGTPKIVKSDNGSPFQSAEFANYALLSGFKHRRVTPLWPEANGEAERFVKTIKKAITAAKVERKDWHLEMYMLQQSLCRILCMSRIMFISSKVERDPTGIYHIQ